MNLCGIQHTDHSVFWNVSPHMMIGGVVPHINIQSIDVYTPHHHVAFDITYDLVLISPALEEAVMEFHGTWAVSYHTDEDEPENMAPEQEAEMAADVLDRTWPLFLQTVTVVTSFGPLGSIQTPYQRAPELIGDDVIHKATRLLRCGARSLRYTKMMDKGEIPSGWEGDEGGYRRCEGGAQVQLDKEAWTAKSDMRFEGEDSAFLSPGQAMAFIDNAIENEWESLHQRALADPDVN